VDKNDKNSTRIEKASHIVELLQSAREGVDHLNDFVSHTCFVLTRASGHSAYRQFDLLRSKPVTGISGSLRGRVRSLRWRVAFERLDTLGRWSERLGEALDLTGLVLDFAHSLLNSWHRVRAEMDSEDTWDTKSAKIATQIASVCLRSASFKYRSSALDAFRRVERGVHAGRWAGGTLGYDVSHPSRLGQFADLPTLELSHGRILLRTAIISTGS
jgi:hypothetical protein